MNRLPDRTTMSSQLSPITRATLTVKLTCLQHFTGTLDNWDLALTDALASSGREVILFESAGSGPSSRLLDTQAAQLSPMRLLNFCYCLRDGHVASNRGDRPGIDARRDVLAAQDPEVRPGPQTARKGTRAGRNLWNRWILWNR